MFRSKVVAAIVCILVLVGSFAIGFCGFMLLRGVILMKLIGMGLVQ